MDAVPVWVILIVIGLVGSLALLLWNGSDKRHDKHSDRLDDHEHRLTRVETQSAINAEEISKVREMRHDIIDEVSHKLSAWYLDLVKMIRGDK